MELCGAFPETVLNACAAGALVIWDMECVNEYTLRFTVYEGSLPELRTIAERCMCEMNMISMSGGSRGRKLFLRRRWLIIFAVMTAALLMTSSLFIWKIDVRGCETLSKGEVLRALSESGVELGTYWPSLSTDMVRSEMIMRLPKIAWMTVNVNGSRATVLISERQEKPEIYIESDPADIVASKTGIISNMSVLNGRSVTKQGNSVMKGETLVSGLMDSITNEPRLVRAEAQVIASTWTELNSVCPAETEYKTERRASHSRFALRFGKKRINLFFGGGNDIDDCDKIVYEYNLGIEGFFAMPVTLIREKLVPYKSELRRTGELAAMEERLYGILEAGIDGQIIESSISSGETEGLYMVTLRAECLENIARIVERQAE